MDTPEKPKLLAWERLEEQTRKQRLRELRRTDAYNLPLLQKQRQAFIASSEVEAERPRKKMRGKRSLAILRNYATSVTVMPNLPQGTEAVTPEVLAAELEVEPIRLFPLIERGYLKVETVTPVTVVRPQPAAMEWLKGMFLPLPMRPFLPSAMAAELTGVTLKDFRGLCVAYNVPLQDDPAFGELMSIAAFHRFFEALHHFREPSRFDRAALLTMLLTAMPVGKRTPKSLPFDKRLDAEIRRIAKLLEPDKTEQALLLWESYSDAKVIADVAAQDEGLEPSNILGMDRVKTMLESSLGEL